MLRDILKFSGIDYRDIQKERGRFLVESVKVYVLRLKNSSRWKIFTKYVYFLLKRTIDKFFLKVNINFYRSTTVLTKNTQPLRILPATYFFLYYSVIHPPNLKQLKNPN